MLHVSRTLSEDRADALGKSLIIHAAVGIGAWVVFGVLAYILDKMPHVRRSLARRFGWRRPGGKRPMIHGSHHHHRHRHGRGPDASSNAFERLMYLITFWYKNQYRDTHFFLFVEIAAMSLSIVVCGLYTWGTYRMDISGILRGLNIILGIGFTAVWLARFYFAELRLKFVFSRVGVLQAFALPSLLSAHGQDQFLHFGYFMAYGAYEAFVRLQTRILFLRASGKRMMFKSSERRKIILENVLHFCAIVYILAATIQLLEIPGDILSDRFVAKWELYGKWNLFNCIYFVIVTLSTVGYGDISPETFQGRIFVIFAIVIGIILFSNLITDLVESTRQGMGAASFRKSQETRHVIFAGSPQLDVLRHFILEFYALYQNTNTKVVVLAQNPSWSSDEFSSLLGSHFMQSRIAFVAGSAINAKALERAELYTADAIFLISSPTACSNPAKEDISTAMQALAIRNVRSDIPIFAVALLRQSLVQLQHATEVAAAGASDSCRRKLPDSAQYRGLYRDVLISERIHLPEIAFSECETVEKILERTGCRIGDERKKEKKKEGGCDFLFNDLDRSEVLCLQRLHTALLASNILCNGIGTLMTNMSIDIRPHPSNEDPKWLSEYHMGATCDLHYGIIPEAFDHVPVKDVANLLYYHGLILLATQTPNGRIFEPVTKTSSRLEKYYIGMFLTYLRRGDVIVALRTAALKFRKNPNQYRLTNTSEVRTMKQNRSVFDKRLSSIPAPEIKSPEFNFTQIEEVGVTTDDEYFTTPKIPRWKGDPSESEINIFDSSLDLNLLRLRGQALGDVPPGLEKHIIISVNLDESLGNIPLFLHTLWRKRGKSNYTKRTKKRQVVIIAPKFPKTFYVQFRKYLGRCLFVVKGNVHRFTTWKRALIATANAVITLGDYRKNVSDADAETMFTTLTLDKMTQADSDLFISSELLEEASLEYLRLPFHSRRRGARLGEAVCLNTITDSDNDWLRNYASAADVEDSDYAPPPPPARSLHPAGEPYEFTGRPGEVPVSPPPLDLYAGAKPASEVLPSAASGDQSRRRRRRGTARVTFQGSAAARSGYAGDGEQGDDIQGTEDEDTADDIIVPNADNTFGMEALGEEQLLDQKLGERTQEKSTLKTPTLSFRRFNTPRTHGATRAWESSLDSELGGGALDGNSNGDSDLDSTGQSFRGRSSRSDASGSESDTDQTLSSSEAVGDDREERDQRRKARSRRGKLYSRDRYASGELVIYSSLYTVLTREYVEPGFAGLFANMVGAADGEREGQKIRLLQIPPSLFRDGKPVEFGRIFDVIVQLGGTPLGLYRSGRAEVRLPRRQQDKRENRGHKLYDQLEELLRTLSDTQKEKKNRAAKLAAHLNVTPTLAFTERVDWSLFGKRRKDAEIFSDDSGHGPERGAFRPGQKKTKTEEGIKPSSPVGPNGSLREATPDSSSDPEGTYTFADTEYQYQTLTESHNLLPYVFTFPDPFTVVGEGDGIYVLCDAQFELPYAIA